MASDGAQNSRMQRYVRSTGMAAAVMAGALAIWPRPGAAQDPFGPLGPFRPGEGLADRAATCATLPDWIDHAPGGGDRITLTVRGRLSAVDRDDALAYLVLCEAEEVQVLCVTYETGDFRPGDGAVMAGGYIRAGERQVMLDPCLATPPR